MMENPNGNVPVPSAADVAGTPAPGQRSAARRDSLFVLLSFVLGFLLCELLLFGGFGIGVPVYVIFFYAVSLAFLRKNGLKWSGGAVLTLVPIVLLLLCFVLYSNLLLRFFNVVALYGLLPLHLSCLAGANEYRVFTAGTLWDIFKGSVIFPFSNLNKSAVAVRSAKSGRFTNVIKAVLGILIISPLIVGVIALLSSSDAAFSRVVSAICTTMRDYWGMDILKILLGFLFLFPIFSFLFSLYYKNTNYAISRFRLSRRIRVIDPIFINSSLWVLSMIYVLYIVTQIGYFFSAMRNVLPGGFSSYSEYARRGFFELCGVCVINLVLITFSLAFSRRRTQHNDRNSRVTVIVLSLLTLLLIATAISKMVMYINFYGLTLLRLYTTWLMAAMFAVFVFIIIKELNRRFRLLHAVAVGVTVLYLALNFLNVDALIPAVNIARYQNDLKRGVDLTMFTELSDSMVPQAAKMLNDPQYVVQMHDILRTRKESLEHMKWENGSVSSWQALYTLNHCGLK